MSPLHEAAFTGNTPVVKEWVARKRGLDQTWDEPNRGLEGNYARLTGLTPLMMAARGGQLEAARLLVEGGANLYAQANTQLPGEPLTAFDFAVRVGHIALADYLWRKSDGLRLGAQLSRYIGEACSRSCDDKAGGDARTNMALFLMGIAPEAALGKGIGEAACYAARPLDTLAFIEKHLGRLPRNTLHCMAFQTQASHRPLTERMAVVSWLIDHGADVNDRSFTWTPLIGAAVTQPPEMAALLLQRGADPNLRNDAGLTPIGAAADKCIRGINPPDSAPPALEAQLAVVELLAKASDPAVYASPEARSKLGILNNCCARRPQAGAQRRICEAFGI